LRKHGAQQGLEVRIQAEVPELPVSQQTLAEDRELKDAVAAFKARLKPRFQQFFELHFVQGLPYQDVAERTGMSRLKCRYHKKVIALRARNNKALMAALGRHRAQEEQHAPPR